VVEVFPATIATHILVQKVAQLMLAPVVQVVVHLGLVVLRLFGQVVEVLVVILEKAAMVVHGGLLVPLVLVVAEVEVVVAVTAAGLVF
jgi:hypothetical protein